MAETLTIIVEEGLHLVLVLTEVIDSRREVAVVTAEEAAMVVEEAAEEAVLETMVPMMGGYMVDMPTTWKPTMSMILRLLTKIPITRISVHTQAIIRVLESMKVR